MLYPVEACGSVKGSEPGEEDGPVTLVDCVVAVAWSSGAMVGELSTVVSFM